MGQGSESTIDEAEKEFRKDRLWVSFKAALYGVVSGAAFTGALVKLATMAVDAFQKTQAGEAAWGALQDARVMGVMGGLALVGTVATYLAQIEWTELQCLNDEHLARKNAECMARQQSHAVLKAAGLVLGPEPEHPDQCRGDGKEWVQITARGQGVPGLSP